MVQLSEGVKEIEARWINLDAIEIKRSLKSLGAKKLGSFFFREWMYEYPQWKAEFRRVRVRTDGKKTWLTYKANPTWTVNGTEELEIMVSSIETTIKLLEAVGLPLVRYQEKKRESFQFGDIIFDLDFWPNIPMVLEIEAPSIKKVKSGAELLGLKWKDAIFENQLIVHQKYFGIDLDNVATYRFNSPPE